MSDETWDPFKRAYIESGWQRFLPSTAINILPILAIHGSVSRLDLDEELRRSIHSAEGLDSDVWDPLEEFTDADLRKLDEEFEGTPFERSESEPQTADEVNAEERATRREKVAELESFSSHLGLPVIHTLGDLLDFMTAAGVVILADGEYSISRDARLPEEVLPLSELRREEEALLRWGRIHEGLAQRIIALFKPDGEYSINSLSTTIDGLAKSLTADPQSIREALVVLLDEGDFTSSDDPLRAASDQLLEVNVDWDAFHSSRFSVRFGSNQGEDD